MKQWIFSLSLLCVITSCDQKANSSQKDELQISNPFDSVNSLIKESPSESILYFKRAILHYDNKDLSSSLSDVGRALKLDSSNADYYVLLSNLKLLSKQSRESKDALLKAYKVEPGNLEVLLRLGEIYMLVEEYESSFRYLNEALKVDIHSAMAYRLKGFNYKYAGDTVNAVSSFQTAIEQDPQDYDSYLQLGLLFSVPLKPIAIDYYNNALKVRPTSLEAMYAKAMHLQQIGESRSAINLYNDMIKLNKAYFNAHYNKGFIYLEQLSKYDSSSQAFTDAITNGPKDYFQAVYNRGLARERAKDFVKAEEDYRLALQINPQFDPAAQGLTRLGK